MGLIPVNNNGEEAYCGAPETGPTVVQQCSQNSLDMAGIEAYFQVACQGLSSCHNLNIAQYIKTEPASDCTNENAILYLQYFCL